MRNSILGNVTSRLRLLKCALSERYIYSTIHEMSREAGVDYSDVFGDLTPFEILSAEPESADLFGGPDSFLLPGAPKQFNSEPSVGRFLAHLVSEIEPENVVEVGCFVGWATAHMAEAMSGYDGGMLHVVDLSMEYLDQTMRNLVSRNLAEKVVPHCGGSMASEVLAELPDAIDLVFLDTSHSYPITRDEVLEYSRRLSDDGLIVLHDAVAAPGVRKSLAELTDSFRMHVFATERSNGVAVLKVKN